MGPLLPREAAVEARCSILKQMKNTKKKSTRKTKKTNAHAIKGWCDTILTAKMHPVKLYTGLTLAYGAFFVWRRDYYAGLAVTSVMAAPFVWPVYLIEDCRDMRRRT